MEVAFAGIDDLLEDAVSRFEVSRPRVPGSKGFAAHTQLLAKVLAPGTRTPSFHLRNDRRMQLETLEGGQAVLPACRGSVYFFGRRRKMNNRLARDVVQTAIVKNNRVMADHRLKIAPQAL